MFALALVLAACSTERERDTPLLAVVRQNVQGPATTAHPYSVGICAKSAAPGTCNWLCTGTLVAPNLVLTARHCVDNTTDASGGMRCGTDTFTTRLTTPATTWVTTHHATAQATTGWHGVAEIRTPTATDACESDIALLVLSSSVPASEAAPADVLAFGPMTDHSRYSTEIAIVGYGLNAANAPGTSGVRRLVDHIRLQCIVDDPTFSNTTFCKNGGVVSEPDGASVDLMNDTANFLAAWGGCSGDSGSGALEQRLFDEGKPLVMGVLSRNSKDGAECLQLAYTRTDYWKTFLIEGANAAAQAGGYPLPAWAQGPTVAPIDYGYPPAPKPDAAAATEVDAGGAVGDRCQRPSDCQSGACVALEERAPQCVAQCGADASCGAGLRCRSIDGHDLCIPMLTVSDNTSGLAEVPPTCAIGTSRAPAWLALGFVLFAARLRRRRR